MRKILITLGDPKSITIECLSKVLFPKLEKLDDSVIFIGSRKIFDHQVKQFYKKNLTPNSFEFIDIDETNLSTEEIQTLPEKIRGVVAVKSLKKAGELIKENPSRYSILTCPIDKKICSVAGFHFPGQTEFFEFIDQTNGLMCLAVSKLRVGLVSNHLTLRDVFYYLNIDLIAFKIETFAKGLREVFGIDQPKIAVLGVNPHTGDRGLFGYEEIEVITPAIQKVMKNKCDATIVGPVPADTAFYQAFHGSYDGVLAMYHDQGLGPLKTVHFDTAVNVTLGLKFLRVSPDHGPATDLYGLNKASTKSFDNSLDLLLNRSK